MSKHRNRAICNACGKPFRKPRHFGGPGQNLRCPACRPKPVVPKRIRQT
jgi:hypothetical protein